MSEKQILPGPLQDADTTEQLGLRTKVQFYLPIAVKQRALKLSGLKTSNHSVSLIVSVVKNQERVCSVALARGL